MTRAGNISLTERETSVLGPLAEHRLLTVPQVAVLLGVTERTAVKRLRQLEHDRTIRLRSIFDGLPWAASIQSRGLRALGSALKPPHVNFNEYRHEVGVGWLYLAARAGSFGELHGIATDRRMQAEDLSAKAAGRAAPWGLGLGTLGSNGRPQHHYADLILDAASGQRLAVELELTAKSSGRMAAIMTAYASDASVDHVLYLAATRTIAERVLESARRAGIPERVHVRRLAADGIAGAEIGRVRSGTRARAATLARGSAER
ncbi:MAG: hypothetical protein ACRDLT_00205 [Solirubrobacteraceae bacterium]